MTSLIISIQFLSLDNVLGTVLELCNEKEIHDKRLADQSDDAKMWFRSTLVSMNLLHSEFQIYQKSANQAICINIYKFEEILHWTNANYNLNCSMI